MKTYDLSKKLKNLEGNESNKASEFLSDMINLTTEGLNVVKAYGWAEQLKKEGKLSIDDSDLEKILKPFIENNKGAALFVKAQLLERFKEAKK